MDKGVNILHNYQIKNFGKTSIFGIFGQSSIIFMYLLNFFHDANENHELFCLFYRALIVKSLFLVCKKDFLGFRKTLIGLGAKSASSVGKSQFLQNRTSDGPDKSLKIWLCLMWLSRKRDGTVLGQAHIKLELYFTSFKICCIKLIQLVKLC